MKISVLQNNYGLLLCFGPCGSPFLALFRPPKDQGGFPVVTWACYSYCLLGFGAKKMDSAESKTLLTLNLIL